MSISAYLDVNEHIAKLEKRIEQYSNITKNAISKGNATCAKVFAMGAAHIAHHLMDVRDKAAETLGRF